MRTGKKTVVSRDFRVTVIVEEIEAPKMADEAPKSDGFWKSEVEEFLEESYNQK
jgi:hypothetical protein